MTAEKQLNYIDLKTEKAFGEMLGIPFTFLFQEFKGLFLSILRYAGPFFLLTGIFTFLFFKETFNNSTNLSPYMTKGISFSLIMMTLSSLISVYLSVTIVMKYISLYSERGKGNFTLREVGQRLWFPTLKIIGAIILTGIMMVPVAFLFSIISYIGPLLLFVTMIYIGVKLSLFPMVIVHEKTNIWNAFSRSFEIIKFNWWFSFGIYAIFIIMCYFSFYIIVALFAFLSAATFNSGLTDQTGVYFGLGFVGLIFIFLYLMMIILISSLFALNYFNLNVRDNKYDLSDRIDAINKIVDKPVEEKNKITIENPDTPENDSEGNRFLDDTDNNRFKPKY
jgi:hypothetical protein